MRLLDELYAMGLHLSIDDFGTGYSSLSALQQFPIGTLKIDQSFVRDVSEDAGDATIVRTIIEMGRSLGMEVIAEGVESQRAAGLPARATPATSRQGKLFGEPCTAEDLLALLTRQAAGTGAVRDTCCATSTTLEPRRGRPPARAAQPHAAFHADPVQRPRAPRSSGPAR